MYKKLLLSLCVMIIICIYNVDIIKADEAKKLNITVTMSDGRNSGELVDNSYYTYMTVRAGNNVKISSDKPIKYVYVKWYNIPKEYEVKYGDSTIKGGENGFLHELITLPYEVNEVTLNMSVDNPICEIEAYSAGDLPQNVQVWEKPCDNADILVISSHADDEILFLGGVLAIYAGEKDLDVQVVYFSDYSNGVKIREHEKLDGLWMMGVTHYPDKANFDDLYSETLDQAMKLFDYDKVLSWHVEMIRKYKPLVVATQDIKGEYGHGTHMLIAKATMEAVDISGDANKYPESAKLYGVYDVPKTYLHLWPENKIKLDTGKALTRFNGMNCVEIASASYKQHMSQQWCWFYVSDTNQYSIADFGLYRSLVGADTGNDMMENVVSYEEQARLKAIEEAKRLEEEELKAIQKAKEEEESRIAEEKSKEAYERQLKEKAESDKKFNLIMLGIVIVCCFALGISIFAYSWNFNSKRRRKRRRKIR